MATAYTNPAGSGNRQTTILITVAGLNGNGLSLIDGTTASGPNWLTSSTGCSFEFWFPSKKIIDEAKFYQTGTQTHGTWQWSGSQDRVTWTNIGGTFTLGGATAQTITTPLTGNTTAYVFYRVVQTAGSASSGPNLCEWEFKIDEGGQTSYAHALGSGNRTASITLTASGITAAGGGALTTLLEGNRAAGTFWNAAANAGHWLTFDFGASYVVQQARFFLSNISNQGDWKFQGSTNNSTWVDLSPTFTMGLKLVTVIGGFESNVTSYRYYRLLGVSGSRTNTPSEWEIEFMVGAPLLVTVPNVVGLTQSAATTAMTAVGLTLGTVTPVSSTTVAAGLVISQTPAAAATATVGSAVSLVVSTGPPMVTVPNVVGLMESAAQAAITAAGLTVAPHTQAPSAAPIGQVLAQSPAAGASVALGTAVQLQISRGAKAWTSARSGIARSGATRSNYVFPDVPGVVVIGGVDYTARILNGSLQVHLEINDKPDTCSFQAYISNEGTQAQIAVGVEVFIGLTSPAGSNPIFGGQIVQVQTTRNPASIDSLASVMCADFLQIVDSQYLITYDWPAQSATTTILDLVARFANKPGGVTISTAGVQAGLPSHQAFGVINERFSTVLRRMVTMFPTPGGFYIDAGKVLRVWTGKPEPGHTQPTAFTLANPHLKQFADLTDGTPVRDAVIVEGRRTTAPIGVVPHPTVPDRLRDFPVADASILDRVHDQPGREIRVGTQRAIVRYAYGVWSSPAGTPQSTVTTADVAFNPVLPPTTINIPVASVTMFLGRLFNSWVKVDEQYLIVTSAPGPHIVVVTSGWGGMTGPIKAGAAVSMIDSFVEVTLTGRYDAPGSPEVPRAQGRDADVVMVVRSSTAPGIHEQLVQDGRYVISGATNRGQHEIADFALPAKSIQFETTDTNALPGRVQSYSFVEPPLVTSAGDYMILTTDITWPVWGELPLRTCTAANIGAADIVDAWLVDPR